MTMLARTRDARPYYVYRLRDPLTGLVRYIGISAKPSQREGQHYCGCIGRMTKWRLTLRKRRKRPAMEIVSGPLPYDVAAAWELRLVFLFSTMRPGQLFNAPKQLRHQVITDREIGRRAVVLSIRSAI